MLFSMIDTVLINAIRRLILCGMTPDDAFLICDDFIKRFGKRDLEACIRSVEVLYVA